MEGSDIPVCDPEQRLAQYLQARFDVPAYIRRARQVQDALDQLLVRCRAQRARWLKEGQLVLEDLAALAGSWDDLSSRLPPGADPEFLPRLAEVCTARIVFAPRAVAGRRLRRALLRLADWLASFNQRWDAYLRKLNLGPVNELRDAYNRWFVLEKECALRSARLAHQGFQRLEPLTVADLLLHFPPLPVLPVGERT